MSISQQQTDCSFLYEKSQKPIYFFDPRNVITRLIFESKSIKYRTKKSDSNTIFYYLFEGIEPLESVQKDLFQIKRFFSITHKFYFIEFEKFKSYFHNFYTDGQLKKLIADLMRYNKKNGISIIFRAGYIYEPPPFEKLSIATLSRSRRFFLKEFHLIKQKYSDILDHAERWNQKNKIILDTVIETTINLNHCSLSIIRSLQIRRFNIQDSQLNLPLYKSL